jgi:hypothetical protein
MGSVGSRETLAFGPLVVLKKFMLKSIFFVDNAVWKAYVGGCQEHNTLEPETPDDTDLEAVKARESERHVAYSTA